MPKYRVLAKSFIDNRLVEEGTIVDYDGQPGENLEPLDADGAKQLDQLDDANLEAIARQKSAALGGAPDAAVVAEAASAAAKAAEAALAAAAESSKPAPRRRGRPAAGAEGLV